MDAYITIANCQSLIEEVLDALSDNPYIENTWIHTTKNYAKKSKETNRQRYQNILDNLMGILNHAEKVGDEYFVIINRDIVHPQIAIPTMHNFLSDNPKYGAVGYNTKIISRPDKGMKHVGTGFMMIRTAAVKNFTLNLTDKHACCCVTFVEQFYQHQWKVDYVGYDRNGVPLKFLR